MKSFNVIQLPLRCETKNDVYYTLKQWLFYNNYFFTSIVVSLQWKLLSGTYLWHMHLTSIKLLPSSNLFQS